MKLVTTFILLLATSVAVAQQDKLPDWENPEVFDVNKEPARTTSLPYPDAKSAAADDYSASPYYQSLDGLWKFKWVSKIADAPSGFYEKSYDVGGWKEIPVPGCWEFSGYGIPMYVGVNYGIPNNPPYIDREDSPTGAYRRNFTIPDDWDGRRVFIHFDAGTNSMYVWVNGRKVGYTENSKSPAEFDITPYVRKGVNVLACEVHKYGDGYYLEDQDMWRLGGINRSVYLYSTAQTRIFDFFAHPDLDKNYKNGIFSVDVSLKNYTSASQKRQLEVALLNTSGQPVLRKSCIAELSASCVSNFVLSGKVKSPSKWSAETPSLYTLLLTLKDEDGKIIEVTSHRIGFRKIEIKDGQLFVNGKKIYVKGVNLHEFNAYTGNVVSRKDMMRNLQLMKELNVNAVRTSHYPQPPLWYKLCDEYGIYLVDENNLESHGLGFGPKNVSNNPQWHAAHLDRVKRLVERDKNHPSVIFWSLGNEASNGKAYFDMYDWVKQRDNSRPVQYEQAFNYKNTEKSARNTDILAPMYPQCFQMKIDAAKDLGKPYIMCEYAHAMGNSMGNFQEYWDIIRISKNMQGGFIWEWYNQGHPAHDQEGNFYWAYGGDLNGYKNLNHDIFSMKGIVSPDQKYLPHSHIVKKVYQNILFYAKQPEKGIITVVNDFKFIAITLKNYSFKWVLLKNGKEDASGTFTLNIPANGKKDVRLPLPNLDRTAGNEYYLQVYATSKEATPLLPAGFEVAKGEFGLTGNSYFTQRAYPGDSVEVKQMISDRRSRFTLTANGMTYEFETKDTGGSLLRMTDKGMSIFHELPRLNFWRAPNDNDFGSKVPSRLRVWKYAADNITYKFIGIERTDSNASVKYEYRLNGVAASVYMTYIVNRDGSLTIDADYKPKDEKVPDMVRFGMLMTLPKEYRHFAWYGRGPWENYIDRNKDAFMGIYSGDVDKQGFPYYRPQETGNKTDARWLSLSDDRGHRVFIEGAQPLSVSATNNYPDDFDSGKMKKQWHPTDTPPRNETVLCVDLFQRGLAGTDSWGINPLDEYRFWGNKEYHYRYTIHFMKQD